MAKKRRHSGSAHHRSQPTTPKPQPTELEVSPEDQDLAENEQTVEAETAPPVTLETGEPKAGEVSDSKDEPEMAMDAAPHEAEAVNTMEETADDQPEAEDEEAADQAGPDTTADEEEPAEDVSEPHAAAAQARRLSAPSMPAFVRQRHFWYSVGAVVIVLLLAVVLWWQWQRSWVGVVNGTYISTSDLDEQLEATDGTQLLPQLIQQQLILQEAAKKHVLPSQSAIDKELQTFKDSVGGEAAYQSALKSYNVSEKILLDRIKVRLALEALLKDKITVSDKEVQDYYNSNKSTVDPDNKGLASVKASIVSNLQQQKLQDQSQSYLDSLQKQYNVTSQLGNARLSFSDFLGQNIGQPLANLWGGLTSIGKKK